MSRRTKLIALLVALALVGLTAVEFALIWSPANPLRFRIIVPPAEKLERVTNARTGTEHVRGYLVEVENTTGATIGLMSGSLTGPNDSDGSRAGFSIVHFFINSKAQDNFIPPHESRRFELSPFDSRYVAGLAQSEMRYDSFTRSKENILKFAEYLYRKNPTLFSSVLQNVKTHMVEHTTPVQMGEQ